MRDDLSSNDIEHSTTSCRRPVAGIDSVGTVSKISNMNDQWKEPVV